MIDKMWNRWQEIKRTDAVKTRLVYALFYGGVTVVPFVSVWVYLGLAKAVMAVIGLITTACALFLAAALINVTLGWVARWIYTGQLAWFDFSTTILDEIDSAKYRKSGHPKKVKNVQYNPKPAIDFQEPVSQVCIGNNNVQSMGNIRKFDDGPDWIKK